MKLRIYLLTQFNRIVGAYGTRSKASTAQTNDHVQHFKKTPMGLCRYKITELEVE